MEGRISECFMGICLTCSWVDEYEMEEEIENVIEEIKNGSRDETRSRNKEEAKDILRARHSQSKNECPGEVLVI